MRSGWPEDGPGPAPSPLLPVLGGGLFFGWGCAGWIVTTAFAFYCANWRSTCSTAAIWRARMSSSSSDVSEAGGGGGGGAGVGGGGVALGAWGGGAVPPSGLARAGSPCSVERRSGGTSRCTGGFFGRPGPLVGSAAGCCSGGAWVTAVPGEQPPPCCSAITAASACSNLLSKACTLRLCFLAKMTAFWFGPRTL